MAGNKKHKSKAAAEEHGTDRHKIIVGIDYGTTYSGVSYVTTDKKSIEDISIVTAWPGELSTSWKTPTRIAYSQENHNLRKNKWGFEVEDRHKSYSWTKLLLDKNATPGDFDDPSLSKISGDGLMQVPHFRDAQGVCEDFLREVYVFVSEKLRRQMGSATFDLTAMECWITLPAIWSDQAKDATLRAAKNAGFGGRTDDEVHTISEPEAAAIATLKNYSKPDVVNAVKPNEHILICDCGGGTVDITTYTIVAVHPKLSFDELCVGVGGKCGSTYIDRNLHALLSKRFGKAFDNLPQAEKGPGSRFMSCFEKIKRSFGLENDTGVREIYPLTMDIEDSEFYDEEERTVKLSLKDMQNLFDPVVKDIIKLVKQQIQEARVKKGALINRIILVGGFGDSAYLNQKLTEWCAGLGNIQLMCPDNPQAAVVRGAALRGLEEVAPRTKQSRRHYGYAVAMPFRAGIDREEDGFIDDTMDAKYCSNRASWEISKGEAIVKDTHRSSSHISDFTPGQPLRITTQLLSCLLDDAPDQCDAPGVELVGTIVSDFPANFNYGTAKKTHWNATKQKHMPYVEVDVQVVFGNKGDNLTFRNIINGRVEGTAKIEFTST